MPFPKRQPHRAYLLRLWQARQTNHRVWRASLECAHTGETYYFPTLEMLLPFLEAQVDRAVTDYELEVLKWLLQYR